MVRRIWSIRLMSAVRRLIGLREWLRHWLRRFGHCLMATGRIISMVYRPRDPNNLFLPESDGTKDTAEGMAPPQIPDPQDDHHLGGALLWARAQNCGSPCPSANAASLSLWKGARKSSAMDVAEKVAVVNRRMAYLDLLSSQIDKLTPAQITQLDACLDRLARSWLDVDQTFQQIERRNRLDIRRTLRYNIPRYAGHILTFRWSTKERPKPQRIRPAKILVVGDVSYSMVSYMSVLLYFFHRLNSYFQIDSYIFSNQATRATPYLNGMGTFEEKVKRLMESATSWNAGTRFGSCLAEILATATVDKDSYVIIGTDGKISLDSDEINYVERYMPVLKRKAREVIFLTPVVDFSQAGSGLSTVPQAGSFRYGFSEIPIFEASPTLYYGVLGQYADRLYLVRTVQDLVDVTQNLALASRSQQ